MITEPFTFSVFVALKKQSTALLGGLGDGSSGERLQTASQNRHSEPMEFGLQREPMALVITALVWEVPPLTYCLLLMIKSGGGNVTGHSRRLGLRAEDGSQLLMGRDEPGQAPMDTLPACSAPHVYPTVPRVTQIPLGIPQLTQKMHWKSLINDSP